MAVDITKKKMERILGKTNEPYYSVNDKSKMLGDIREEFFERPKMVKETLDAKEREVVVKQLFISEHGVPQDKYDVMQRLLKDATPKGREEILGSAPGRLLFAYSTAIADTGVNRSECVNCLDELNKTMWANWERLHAETGRNLTAEQVESAKKSTEKFIDELKKTIGV